MKLSSPRIDNTRIPQGSCLERFPVTKGAFCLTVGITRLRSSWGLGRVRRSGYTGSQRYSGREKPAPRYAGDAAGERFQRATQAARGTRVERSQLLATQVMQRGRDFSGSDNPDYDRIVIDHQCAI